MAKTTIEITGSLGKNIKVNPDGTAEVLMKNTMSTGVPKGLKSLGASNYLVQFGTKTWRKLSSQLSEETFVRISGEPKASVTKSGVPYIHVVAFNVLVIDLNEPAKDTNSLEQELPQRPLEEHIELADEFQIFKPIDSITHTEDPVKWFEHPFITSNFVTLDATKIILTEKEHLKTKLPSRYISRKSSEKLTMVVRPLNDGTYSLTTGFINYLIAKLYNIPASVFIFEGDKEQLTQTYNVSL